MAIQLLVGSSGTGKTNYIYDQVIEKSMESGHAPIYFLLPEQSNMAAEQEMVMRHPMGGTLDVSIVSFSRLAFKVFDELGVATNDILDDFGKSMVIMKVLKEHQSELVFYKSMLGKPGFVEEVKSIISELYQYQITEQTMEQVLDTISPEKSLSYKLRDLKLILHAFNEQMQGSYMVAEQLLSLLAEVIKDSKEIAGAEIYFDGFTGFTPVQMDVISALLSMGCNLYVSITMDAELYGKNECSDNELFSPSKKMADSLLALAGRIGATVLPHEAFANNYRLGKNSELQHLERQLFRFPTTKWENENRSIHIASAKNVREEAMYVARTIRSYVMEKGYEYRDFAVVMGNVAAQADVWKECMDTLDIPYFLDCNEPLSHNPFVDIIQKVFNLFDSDFSFSSVFALLKTGFFDMSTDDIYLLENYALKYGVQGYSWWANAFRGGIKGLHNINETRESFMKQLASVIPVFSKKKANGEEYILAIYNFMAEHKMAEKLRLYACDFEENGMLRQAAAYRQAYEKWIQVLDKTMVILGQEELQRDVFVNVLISGIANISLGIIPSTLDQVVIGDLERTRHHHVKVLFVVGMNDGILPRISREKGILVERDREILKENNVSLAPKGKEETHFLQFYFYLQTSVAKEELYLTYPVADVKGEEQRPSYYLKRIKSIFPRLEEERVDLQNSLPMTEKELVWDFAQQIGMRALDDSSMFRILQKNQPDLLEQILSGYRYNNQVDQLNQTIAKRLFGIHMEHSVSRLESYAACAYQFFLRYGLKIEKRPEYKVETNNIGTILHAVMETFFTKVRNKEVVLSNLSDVERDAIVEQLTIQAAKDENETIFESNSRKKHQLQVLIRIAKRSIENLCRHVEKGGMEPSYFEKKFSKEDQLSYIKMALEDDMSMELRGIIDRVDVKEYDDAIYVKVIDYKSGAKDIDYKKMYEGKQLQLTVYLSVMLELLQKQYPEKTIIPTGMYYYQMSDPIVSANDEDALEELRVKGSRLSGLVNEDETCRDLMDQKTGEVTPVKYKTDGELDSRNSALVSTEDLLSISQFVRGKMTEIGNDIIHGQISMNPEKGSLNGPCDFCDYRNICRFEPGFGGNRYRIAPQIDKNEAKRIILNKDKDGGETHELDE